ncbi:hypothetical protein [Pedobacter aquatilis]|uniref:hypothetical protein n=1 Tax=Pedobacter aquatilis TaxID=351343 RepID=UPI00292CA646|nr:hypothetical protein [Pedobacter aquatilis]
MERVGQTNQYDKIIKENLEVTLPMIIEEVLELKIISSEELPDDLQHTKERKPDALKKVTDSSGTVYVLHLEFQIKNETDMVYRMAEYNVMLMRKYKLPVKQFVIYLNSVMPKMRTSFDYECHRYQYNIVRISEVNYQLFLKSDNPQIKMLGLLADIDQQSSGEVIQRIVNEIHASVDEQLLKNKYFKQLRIFVQLRKHLEPQFEKAMQSVSTFFKEKDDIFYRKGEASGVEKGKKEGIEIAVGNIIQQTSFTDKKIAEILKINEDFVSRVRLKLNLK